MILAVTSFFFIALVYLAASQGWHALFFLSLFLLMTLIEVLRPKRSGAPWDYMRLCYLMYVLLFVLIPFHYQTGLGEITRRLQPDTSALVAVNLCLLIGYVSILAGYYFKGRDLSIGAPVPGSGPIPGMKFLGIAFFLFGIASFLVYAQIYGGILELFRKVDLIRAGVIGESGFVFIRKFLPFITFGAWILLSRFLLPGPPSTGLRKVRSVLLLGALLSIAVAATMATAGRLDVFFVLIPVCLAPFFLRGRLPPTIWSVSFLLAGVFWILVGKQVFLFMTYGSGFAPTLQGDTYFRLLNEFMHPFESLLAALGNVPYPHNVRGIADIHLALESLLPAKLLGLKSKETLSMVNTFLLIGVKEAIIPPGILGFFFHALSWPGILIGCFLFGFAMRIVEEFFLRRMNGEPFTAYLYVAFGITCLYFMMAGDPVVYIQNYFWLISGTLCVFLFRRLWSPRRRGESFTRQDRAVLGGRIAGWER